MYLGRARDHATDTYRFLNLETELVLISRDVIWLNKVYGEFKGSKQDLNFDTIGVMPKPLKIAPQTQQQNRQDLQQGTRRQEQQNVRPESKEDTGAHTQSKGVSTTAVGAVEVKRGIRE